MAGNLMITFIINLALVSLAIVMTYSQKLKIETHYLMLSSLSSKISILQREIESLSKIIAVIAASSNFESLEEKIDLKFEDISISLDEKISSQIKSAIEKFRVTT